ncbi:MAG: hypothetical protein WC882_05435 [Candidatus Gracilibacteria bacterium]
MVEEVYPTEEIVEVGGRRFFVEYKQARQHLPNGAFDFLCQYGTGVVNENDGKFYKACELREMEILRNEQREIVAISSYSTYSNTQGLVLELVVVHDDYKRTGFGSFLGERVIRHSLEGQSSDQLTTVEATARSKDGSRLLHALKRKFGDRIRVEVFEDFHSKVTCLDLPDEVSICYPTDEDEDFNKESLAPFVQRWIEGCYGSLPENQRVPLEQEMITRLEELLAQDHTYLLVKKDPSRDVMAVSSYRICGMDDDQPLVELFVYVDPLAADKSLMTDFLLQDLEKEILEREKIYPVLGIASVDAQLIDLAQELSFQTVSPEIYASKMHFPVSDVKTGQTFLVREVGEPVIYQ